MRPEGIAAAQREFRRALRAYYRLSSSRSFETADDAWADFLTHAGKIYTKLRAACYGHPRDFGWYGKKLDERDSDPLLLYIHKARNSETHRLEGITLHVRANKRQGQPRHVRALPVTDANGKVYQPPTRCRDIEFTQPDVALMANLATAYLYSLVKEAASRLR